MKIWKFPLNEERIKMPIGSWPLSVGLDPSGVPCIWCAVDDQEPGRWYRVIIAVTGGNTPNLDSVRFVGSFVHGDFVGHVYFDYNWSPA